MTLKSIQAQRGGFVLGLIVGLLLGLAIALGVALYVTKAPVPLLNKAQNETPEQDAADAQKSKTWDPNAALVGKVIPRPQMAAPASGAAADAAPAAPGARPAEPLAEGQRPPPVLPPPPANATPAAPATHAAPAAAATASHRDPAAILNGAPAVAAADAYTYWVQVGAYARAEDAEQQRARLAMLGLSAKVSERDQGGRAVHRVRLGPFDTREQAEAQRQQVLQTQPEASLVRVDRNQQP